MLRRLRILALGVLLLAAPVAPVLRCAECCLGRMAVAAAKPSGWNPSSWSPSGWNPSSCCSRRSAERESHAARSEPRATLRAAELPSSPAGCACLVGEAAAGLDLCVSLPEAPKQTALVATFVARWAAHPDCGRAHPPERSPSLRC